VETWHLVAGGAVLVGAALVLSKKVDELPPSGLVAKTGSSSEQARAQQLIPAAQVALRDLQERLETVHGIRTYVGSTRRRQAEQDANVAKGVSATKNSWHLLGRGVDLYPYDPTTGKPDLPGKQIELFRTMHLEAAKFGWRGLAFNQDGSRRYITTTKGKVWDGGHLEFPEGMTFAQASHQKGGGLA
jgi:hypothetical protein